MLRSSGTKADRCFVKIAVPVGKVIECSFCGLEMEHGTDYYLQDHPSRHYSAPSTERLCQACTDKRVKWHMTDGKPFIG